MSLVTCGHAFGLCRLAQSVVLGSVPMMILLLLLLHIIIIIITILTLIIIIILT